MLVTSNPYAIYEIAAQCREDLEAGRVSDDLLVDLYERYLPDQTRWIEQDLKVIRPRFPVDNCQPATVYLRHHVGHGVIEDGRYRVGNKIVYHTFLNVGRTALSPRTIADITADQFNGPTTYIGELVEPWIPDPQRQTRGST